MRQWTRGLAAGLIVFILMVVSVSALAAPPIRIGSKNYTEQLILGELMLQALEAAGYSVQNRLSLGGSAVVRQALEVGEIDVYAEYTGTALLVHFSGYGLDVPREVMSSPAESFQFVQEVDRERNDLHWLCPADANNTYAIAVRRHWAEEHGIFSVADLAAYVNGGGRVVFASNTEFIDRPDGLIAFEETYGFSIPRGDVIVLGQGSYGTAQALANGANGVNAAMVFGTDGTIAAYDLVVLEDPLGAMPIYQPAPVVRGELLQAEPGVQDVLCQIFSHLDGQTLSALNAEVDVYGRRPADVAAEFLRQIGVAR
ncbi:MAG: ABC transporter substrate-binding protein [Firmicutes bacterium]|nr:ABC transporter substrate-binding protein [Bacillota bacterium]